MHYSALNAVNAASPASASPSSSSLSPIGSSLVGNHSHSQSHSHYHHLSSNDGSSSMSHHSELMASLSDSGLSPVSVSQSAYNGVTSSHSVVSKSEPMCDDLATSTTYTTLQSAGSAPASGNTHNGHYAAQQSTANQSMAQSGNSSSSAQAKGIKRSAPSATATKSTYSNGGKANGTAATNGTATVAAGAGGSSAANSGRAGTGSKKTKGRVKIKMEFIDNKLRRYTTFSKRKTGIMKKAYELSTLTGTQVMLLVASETGHVYTFATRKLQPMITSDAGKALIQTCLNSPDPSGLMSSTGVGNGVSSGSSGPDVVTTNGHVSSLVGSSTSSSNGSNSVGGGQHLNSAEQHHNSDLSRMMAVQQQGSGGGGGGGGGPTGSLSGCSTPNTVIDQRMSATGFEETELSYSVNGDDCSPLNDKQHLYHASPAPSSASSLSSASSSCAASSPPILLSMSAAGATNHSADHNGVNGNGSAYHESIEVSQHGYGGAPSSSYHHHHSPMLQSSSTHHHSLHSQQASPHHQSQQFTTLNSALSMTNGGGLMSGAASGNPSMSLSSSTAITPTSVSSFFNSFGSGTGNSPPPLTPNGLLSGLHSFLFADSSTLGLDSFSDCVGPSDVGCLLPPPVSSVNSYLQSPNGQGQQSGHAMIPPSSTSPVSLTGLNSASPSLFNNLSLGSSVNLVNSSFASTPNGHLLRQRGSTMPQTNFFINETPELGQCSEDDEDDEEEEDEDEEMEEGEDDVDLDSDMAYLAGLQSMDTDLTRFIGGAIGPGTSTPLLLNDTMLGSAMWPNAATQQTMSKPVNTMSVGQLQQQQQQGQQQCTGSSAGFVSDRTKLNLNLKLQQKQQMHQRSQPLTTPTRSVNSQPTSQQRSSQAFNANFQGPKQTNAGKATNLPKSITTSLVKNVNSKRLTFSSKSSGKSAAGTSNLNSNCSSSVLNASSNISSMNSSNSSFVNFDPASFLDSCFNTGNVSPESTSLLDGHSSLDQMLNSSELLLMNQPNSTLGQTMTTEQLMMMIGSQTPISHGQYSAPTSKSVSTGPNSGGSMKSTTKNNNNRPPVSSQILGGTRTPTSLMQQTNSFSFSSSSAKHLNGGSIQSNFSSTHSGNGSSNSSGSSSLCPTTTSTVSTFSNHKQAQSVAQSKAANLNAIINNLASANNGVPSVGAGAGSQNSGSSLDGNNNTLQQSALVQCPPNRVPGNSGTLLEHSAAQQLFSAGNIILCTSTPTSSTIAFPPAASAAAQLDQRHSVTSLANSTATTSTGSAQIFSFPSGISAGGIAQSAEGPPTTLLLPANLHTASGQLSIQQPVASGVGSGGQHAQQLIYNAFSRFIYPSSASSANQGQFNCNRPVETNISGPLACAASDSTQTISTLISHDGHLYQLNVANNSASPIAQIVTPNMPFECSSSSRARIKTECHSDGSTPNSSISLVQPNATLLNSDLHSISLDSLLGSSLGTTPLITTFQPTLTPISANNSTTFGSAKPGLKKQRSK